VIGDGEHHEDLVNLAEQLGIGEHSHFPGFVSPTGDLPELYRLASVFTTASEIETQGLVLLEALASGLPVVAVDATCIPELVIDGKNGFLVPPRDTDAMADRLDTIISNHSLSERMGRFGQAVVQEHSSTTALNKHEALYQELHAQCLEMPEKISFINRYQSFFRQLPRIELRGKDH
jgi:1,2-diacylglycerol 3-alpha-glucosyltransferase